MSKSIREKMYSFLDHEDQTLVETGSTTTQQTKGMNVTHNDAEPYVHNPSPLRMNENKKNETDTMEASSTRTGKHVLF